ncbi:MAG: SET domain-containing protein-lysine N-methyltransferase [Planctomycetales bacterium]|nr:SET domain-containing protein-lysine N-methyltransferase [Planctomycetales bacterium]
MAFYPSELIYCKKTPHRGRGVFARRLIPENTIIETVPVIVWPANELQKLGPDEVLGQYVFHWSPGMVALALGYGSLYNHSYQPNARCVDIAPRTKRFIAIRDIQPNEEITFNYNGAPENRDPVGFVDLN